MGVGRPATRRGWGPLRRIQVVFLFQERRQLRRVDPSVGLVKKTDFFFCNDENFFTTIFDLVLMHMEFDKLLGCELRQ